MIVPVAAPRTGVVACVAPSRRKRLQAALAGAAQVSWHSSFSELADVLAETDPSVVIMDPTDASGQTASMTAAAIATASPSVSIVLYATQQEILSGAIGSPAITDLIVAGETDGKLFVRGIVLDAVKRRAADRVAVALRARMSQSLASFAEWAVRHPICNTVESVAEQLGVHRQTAANWCRKERFLRPEELLMWCRLLLVGAILERTDISVSSLATDLEFPSVIALRNQLKRYTGLTALEVRSAGFDAVLRRFDDRVAMARHRRESAEPMSAVR